MMFTFFGGLIIYCIGFLCSCGVVLLVRLRQEFRLDEFHPTTWQQHVGRDSIFLAGIGMITFGGNMLGQALI